MKKIILACFLLALSLPGLAGSLYGGANFYMQNTTSKYDNFRGFNIQFSAGYWESFDCFYLAGELFILPWNIYLSETNKIRAESARTTYTYGASFLPGLLLTEKVVTYLRVGYIATRFWGPDVIKSGGQFGLGIESFLSNNWSLRAEYIYTAYSHLAYLGSPHTDQIGLGLIFKLQ